MALTTYITSTEANYHFANDTDYSSAQRTNALTQSFDLVNAYINKEVTVPAVGVWDGEATITAPAILKQAQSELYEYILKRSNDGASEELDAMYESTVNKLRGIQQGELTIPTSQTFSHERGWYIVEKTIALSTGDAYVEKFPAPILKHNYNLVVTTSGYGDSIKFSVFNDSSATAVQTGVANDWDNPVLVDSNFYVRFVGYWGSNDSIRIVGVPSESIDPIITTGPKFKQRDLSYNHTSMPSENNIRFGGTY